MSPEQLLMKEPVGLRARGVKEGEGEPACDRGAWRSRSGQGRLARPMRPLLTRAGACSGRRPVPPPVGGSLHATALGHLPDAFCLACSL